MKKYMLFIFLIFAHFSAFACPVCEKNQPKLLQGIAHGAGPEGQTDYVIVWSMVAIVVVTLFYSLKYLIKPNEKGENHIKRTILNFE